MGAGSGATFCRAYMPENVLVVSAEGPETRIGLLEQGTLAEYFLERKRERGSVGNIYRGKVTRVLPGMQAAFVDLGPTVERAAFLYVADVLGAADEKKLFDDNDGDDSSDDAPEGAASRLARSRKRAASRKIEELLKEGQQILVQIVKDPIGLKGARVTGYLSLPGRYSVFMPAVDHLGVSRRIASDKERKRLRDIVDASRPKGTGFIVRTAADAADDQEVRDDVAFLVKLWGEIGRREKSMKGPGLVYADLDLVLRSLRDLMRKDTKEIVIDSPEQYERTVKFATAFMPNYADRIKLYEGRQPIFDHYGIEPVLRAAVSRRVPLKSGGSLVIDQGEALTAIDVNTGSFVGKSDLEETVTRNNLEACKEIARQLRLRNIGGIIVLDFVDMDKEANRKKVWEAFNGALAGDRSRCNVTKISELGLVEMTRKRTRESLMQLLTEPCPTCEGSAVVKSTTTVAYEVLREVRRAGAAVPTDSIEVECPPKVASLLEKFEREYIDELEKKFQKQIVIRANGALPPHVYKVAGKGSQEADGGGEKSKRRGGGSSRGGRGRSRKKNGAATAPKA
jgi:ribonuclease G